MVIELNLSGDHKINLKQYLLYLGTINNNGNNIGPA